MRVTTLLTLAAFAAAFDGAVLRKTPLQLQLPRHRAQQPRVPLTVPPEMHGPVSPAAARADESFGSALRVQNVVRPLIVGSVITWASFRRHTARRAENKKAEFEADASRITWIGALVNVCLAVFKLFAGITGRSAAMIADAGHSFSDLISDGLTLVALRMSALPADVDHPYGHGRFESVGSLAIGGLLIGAGASFGASSVAALVAPAPSSIGAIAMWAALASILSKEILYRATSKIGLRLNSQVLIANAWHHRSDALSSVVAILGIAGSLLGFRRLDPLSGLVVSGMVSWMGLSFVLEALAQLTDTSDYGVCEAVATVAREVDGVDAVSQVRSRSMGGSVLVDLAIRVDPMLSASCAHHLAEEVRLKVLSEASAKGAETPVSEVLVHVDTAPHDYDCPLQTAIVTAQPTHTEIEARVRSELLTLDEVVGVPRVSVYYLDVGVAVEAQCVMLDDLTVVEAQRVARRAKALLLADPSSELRQVSINLDLNAEEEAPCMPVLAGSAS